MKRTYKKHNKYKRGTNGQTRRRLKRIVIEVFENFVSNILSKLSFSCLQHLISFMLGRQILFDTML